MKIAIQGIRGSFHELAATKFFSGNIEINECFSFAEMPDLITTGVVDGAVIAIENSITGAILSNYQLIDTHNLNIQGEIYLPMIHNLMALPGQDIKDITEVWSHPIAIQHCQKFFLEHTTIRIVEEKDTASVAKIIKEEGLKGIGAIASTKAAEIYKLEILRKEIQNDLSNMTRYFILNKQRQHHSDDYLNNKASLKFIAKMDTGGLADILAIFKKHKLDLTKIQSMPVRTEPWHYSFFIDVSFDDYHQYCQALLTLEKKVKELKILGEYPQNMTVFN